MQELGDMAQSNRIIVKSWWSKGKEKGERRLSCVPVEDLEGDQVTKPNCISVSNYNLCKVYVFSRRPAHFPKGILLFKLCSQWVYF